LSTVFINSRILKITRKGQITIPVEIRKSLQIKENDLLAIKAEKEYIYIKKVDVPEWDEIFSKGKLIAKEKNITPKDILEACSEVRHGK
jgi:AbrB family looped-hinge helix DNA binding protein